MEFNAHFNLREKCDRDYNGFKVHVIAKKFIMVNFFLLVCWVRLRDCQDLPKQILKLVIPKAS